ncbi:hypothetical protein [Mangrovimonas sp. YM274]|uniref:hypothetical protein n=1 Tax=Mangrovimonas sp. YM274 TaxID=3070660 RepID=UPI0027DC371A|nr:hypothetical protein [Mangrovimonas sp. YM274]WMI68265.1 hypothetical protein RBH95_14080 [Mangrovimonas sp. YM274]
MTSIEEINYELGINIMKASVVFIPSIMIEEAKKKNDTIDFDQYGGRVLLIEGNGKNYFLEDNSPALYHVLQKSVLLDGNILKLLQWKEKFDTATFEFILEKYQEQLKGYTFAAEWLQANVKSVVPDVSEEVLGSFVMQYDQLEKHRLDVDRRFGLRALEQQNPSSDPVANEKMELPAIMELMGMENLNKGMATMQETVVPKQDRSERIKVLKAKIEAEADDYLLDYIFGVPTGKTTVEQ